ncbi:hypothetical protein C0Q70_08392 [Pomacea canaliculata]|uniref:Uncharacterized protein n=1 Tax=Pomacea canaliculata TaxID=400727 RepID=A0A2T7PHP8_POMCA|nr:hypothetical protein C0Q70_08392 [Pomacea canaliculata]
MAKTADRLTSREAFKKAGWTKELDGEVGSGWDLKMVKQPHFARDDLGITPVWTPARADDVVQKAVQRDREPTRLLHGDVLAT